MSLVKSKTLRPSRGSIFQFRISESGFQIKKIFYSAIANLQSVAYNLTTPEAQVKPAPKTEKRIKSPLLTLPLLTASSSAIGTDADDVFPYLSTLMKTFSVGMSRRFLTASIILKFAWWGMNKSISSVVISAFLIASIEEID